MKIAVEGCAHGELDKIYESIEFIEKKENIKIDLLLCCGDFQATRNVQDLNAMAVPTKYKQMCSFYKYYSGEKKAPVLTLFVGGNHEASNYLQELPYGGWAAPNIYYLGTAGVVNVGGLRIAGISGIYKSRDYRKGRHEIFPYNDETKRSVYHIRNIDVFRLKQVKTHIDIMFSHDWPKGIYHFGNTSQLLKAKPYFADDIKEENLGCEPLEELLMAVRPSYWFAAHLHCKFPAVVPHKNEKGETEKVTKFLALDKCLPKRKFLQVLDIPVESEKPIELEYDLEWLAILFSTNHLISVKRMDNYLPGPGGTERWDFSPRDDEKELIMSKLDSDLKVPENFVQTATAYEGTLTPKRSPFQPNANPQTEELCSRIGITDPLRLLSENLSTPKRDTSDSPLFCTPPSQTGDLSRVSFIIDSDDASPALSSKTPSPSFQDSSVKDFTPSPVKGSRGSLGDLLPPPKFSASDEDGDQTGEVDTTTESLDDSIDDILIDTERMPVDVPPRGRKFKRRNHEMYKSREDDE